MKMLSMRSDFRKTLVTLCKITFYMRFASVYGIAQIFVIEAFSMKRL